jgi:hypothetical protein
MANKSFRAILPEKKFAAPFAGGILKIVRHAELFARYLGGAVLLPHGVKYCLRANSV